MIQLLMPGLCSVHSTYNFGVGPSSHPVDNPIVQVLVRGRFLFQEGSVCVPEGNPPPPPNKGKKLSYKKIAHTKYFSVAKSDV